MIPKDGPVDVAAVYTELGEPPTADGYDVAYICSNPNGKINPRAKFKPYRVDKFEELTDADRQSINYGMVPKGFINTGKWKFEAELWGQWQPPVPGTHWCRITDFAGYVGEDRQESMSDIKLYIQPSNPAAPMQPWKGTVNGMTCKICAEVSLLNNDGLELSIADFSHMVGNSTLKLSDMYFTLLWGAVDDSELFGATPLYGVQSELKLSGYTSSSTHNIKLELPLTTAMTTAMESSGNDGAFNVYCLCLAPKLTINSNHQVTGNVSIPSLVSLNMWNNHLDTIIFSEGLGTWNTASAEWDTKYISGGANPPTVAFVGTSGVWVDGSLVIENNFSFPDIIFDAAWQQTTPKYDLSKLQVMAVATLRNVSTNKTYYGYSSPFHSVKCSVTDIDRDGTNYKGIKIGGDKQCNEILIPKSSFTLQGDKQNIVPAGTYQVKAGLCITAQGSYYDMTANKNYSCILDGSGNEGSSEWDEWVEASEEFFPARAVYTTSVTFGNNIKIT